MKRKYACLFLGAAITLANLFPHYLSRLGMSQKTLLVMVAFIGLLTLSGLLFLAVGALICAEDDATGGQ